MHQLAITADLVIFLKGPRPSTPQVLLIERKHDPFAGHWALPGGFVDPDETLEQAATRELEEETGVTGLTLIQLQAFGDPGRDPRGRTVTIAFLALLDHAPRVTAGDDASKAQWFSVDALPKLAFDHAKILAQGLKRYHELQGSL